MPGSERGINPEIIPETTTEITTGYGDIIYCALNTGFIDKSAYAMNSHVPRLLTNEKDARVITELKDELSRCKSFTFSVAFVSSEIILGLKQNLYDFAARSDVKQSYIVTSTMNLFNKPRAFEELYKLEQETQGKIKIKVFGAGLPQRKTRQRKYHPKGYYFSHGEYSSVIVGSSNLTNAALKSNYEWNIRFSSMNDGQIVEDIAGAIQRQLDDQTTIDLDREFIDSYRQLYQEDNPQRIEQIKHEIRVEQGYAPNEMQIEALEALRKSRQGNNTRALVISATGTGKTILCAFDVRRFAEEHIRAYQSAPKILFIAHRNLLLTQAKQKFQEVIGDLLSYDLYSGLLSEADCLFSTNVMMSRGLRGFNRNHFDYIIIDESHRSAANTYRSIVNYFTPQFLLGLTATPERADDAQVVFDLFNNNIAYEIRLQQALETGLVCPFHYYGVADLEEIEDLKKTGDVQAHVSQSRVDHIISTLRRYQHANTSVKCLVFCSRLDEAENLAAAFNSRGLRSAFLSGKHSEDEREHTIIALEQGLIEYIFTVDIFNEGVDIPCLNLVVMLRNTESSVVFIQQLGRGLRKAEGKESVVIVDFIGNYANSYMIPLALFGNKGVTKDVLRKRVFDTDDDDARVGYSSVSFDRIATERVFAAIDKATLNGKAEIKKDCQRLNAMLGRKPHLSDFYSLEAVDPRIILSRNDFDDITDVWKYALDEAPVMQPADKRLLGFISKEFIKGKSLVMLLALKALVKHGKFSLEDFATACFFEADRDQSEALEYAWTGLLRVLNGQFFRDSSAPSLIDYFGEAQTKNLPKAVRPSSQLIHAISNETLNHLITDVISTAIKVNSQEYQNTCDFVVGKYYSYRDIWQILGFPKEEVWLNVGGYKTINKITPIFIKYKKDDRTAAVRKYEDGFVDQEHMVTESKSRRSITSNDVQDYIHSTRNPVFVRKSDDENDWMFVGDTDVIDSTETVVIDDDKREVNVVKFLLRFESSVKLSIYNYLTDGGVNTTQW